MLRLTRPGRMITGLLILGLACILVVTINKGIEDRAFYESELLERERIVDQQKTQLKSLQETIEVQDESVKTLQKEIAKIKARNRELEGVKADIDELSVETGLSEEVVQLIRSWSIKTGCKMSIPLALIELESDFNPMKTNLNDNGTTDRGLWQINSVTLKSLWKEVFPSKPLSIAKVFDPVINTKLGLTHLTYIYQTFEPDLTSTLTCYNRGSNGLRNWRKRYGTSSTPYSRLVLKKATKWTKYDRLTKMR